jgi:hypothetical protein
MEALAEEFAESTQFYTVWCREAHAGGDYPQPETIEQRRQYARDCSQHDDASVPVIVDDMEGTLQKQLGGFPNCVYVIDGRGRVVYRAVWTDHRQVRRVLERLDAAAERRAQQQSPGMAVWSEELLPRMDDEPDGALIKAFEIWEHARNYDEPERFYGERSEMIRETYERATGRQSIRPEAATPAD